SQQRQQGNRFQKKRPSLGGIKCPPALRAIPAAEVRQVVAALDAVHAFSFHTNDRPFIGRLCRRPVIIRRWPNRKSPSLRPTHPHPRIGNSRQGGQHVNGKTNGNRLPTRERVRAGECRHHAQQAGADQPSAREGDPERDLSEVVRGHGTSQHPSPAGTAPAGSYFTRILSALPARCGGGYLAIERPIHFGSLAAFDLSSSSVGDAVTAWRLISSTASGQSL